MTWYNGDLAIVESVLLESKLAASSFMCLTRWKATKGFVVGF